MSTPRKPNDPDALSLSPSRSPGGQPDFSNVQGRATTTGGSSAAKPDFSNVQSDVDTVPGGQGGGGAGAQSYTVQPGDTLSHIAQRHYGKASQWHAIFAANRDQLDDPDLIHPGLVLKLPPQS